MFLSFSKNFFTISENSYDCGDLGSGNSVVFEVTDIHGNILKAAQNYTIVNVQKDRTGFTALMLEEV